MAACRQYGSVPSVWQSAVSMAECRQYGSVPSVWLNAVSMAECCQYSYTLFASMPCDIPHIRTLQEIIVWCKGNW